MTQKDEILRAVKFLSDTGAFDKAKVIMNNPSKTDEEKLVELFQLALDKAEEYHLIKFINGEQQ